MPVATGRATRRRDLGPCFAIPLPHVVKALSRSPGAAEENHNLSRGVVCQRVLVASGWPLRGGSLPPEGTIPLPGIVENAPAPVAAEQDHDAARTIVGERVALATWRMYRRGSLAPSGGAELPGVVKKPRTAEENQDPSRIVRDKRVLAPCGGTDRHRARGPRRSVPLPGVVTRSAEYISAEEDDSIPRHVVGERVSVPCTWPCPDDAFGPINAVPLPRIVRVKATAQSAEEDEAAASVVERHGGSPTGEGRDGRRAFSPSISDSIQLPRFGHVAAGHRTAKEHDPSRIPTLAACAVPSARAGSAPTCIRS